ncbi:MAG: hypothetical protein KBD04_06615 [Proteobacteria bacterium]|nr:hypothetical protein [Pseudomonadota bacterium]
MRSKKNLIVQMTFASVVLNVVSVFLICLSQTKAKNQPTFGEDPIPQNYEKNVKAKDCWQEEKGNFSKTFSV